MIKGKFKSEFVDPKKFKKDLLKCYISRFFIEELRNFYTEKERTSFLKKQNPNKAIKSCADNTSSICHQTLYNYSLYPERQKYYVFKSKGILSNLKFYHFHKNDRRQHKVRDKQKYIFFVKDPQAEINKRKSYMPSDRQSEGGNQAADQSPKLIEEINDNELLIERQDHQCQHQIAKEEKIKALEKEREGHLRDYRLIHSGLIEAALSQLLPSRQREADNIKDYSPTGGKYVEMDDPEFDFFWIKTKIKKRWESPI